MATKKTRASKIDFAKLQEGLRSQFQDVNFRDDPSLWPIAPRIFLCLAIAIVVAFVGLYLFVSDAQTSLESARTTEQTLRADYQKKIVKAVSLDELKKQREQIQQYVLQLEKQLPSKAEMAALLSDINQAGLGRSLKFELFRPGQIVIKNYYAELPISLRVTGMFHDMGSFVSDVAHLSRIVTLNNLMIAPPTTNQKSGAINGVLTMETTARTFRYLDTEEIQAQKDAAAKKDKKK